MNPHDVWSDHVPDALSILSTHEPDPIRAAEIRTRCHAALRKGARRPSLVVAAIPDAGWRRALAPAIVGSLCAVYLFEVLSRALRLYRL